jgi:hypothetical protein
MILLKDRRLTLEYFKTCHFFSNLSVPPLTNFLCDSKCLCGKCSGVVSGNNFWATAINVDDSKVGRVSTMLARTLSGTKNDHSPNVVLFPWLAMLVGGCVYYLISRFKFKMPYTALMFIIGAVMGYCSKESFGHNAVTESTAMWVGIDGEVRFDSTEHFCSPCAIYVPCVPC